MDDQSVHPRTANHELFERLLQEAGLWCQETFEKLIGQATIEKKNLWINSLISRLIFEATEKERKVGVDRQQAISRTQPEIWTTNQDQIANSWKFKSTYVEA